MTNKMLDDAIIQSMEYNKLYNTIDNVKTQNTPGNIVEYSKSSNKIDIAIRISKTTMKLLLTSTEILSEAIDVLSDNFPFIDIINMKIYLSSISKSSSKVYLTVRKPLEEK